MVEWKEKRKEEGKEEVGVLRVYGGTSDVQARDDETEVTSLGWPKTGKDTTLLAAGWSWLGWAHLNKKVCRPLHQGVCLNLPMIFCAQSTKKGPGHRGRVQGSFDPRPELHAKNVFWTPQKGSFGDIILCTKT